MQGHYVLRRQLDFVAGGLMVFTVIVLALSVYDSALATRMQLLGASSVSIALLVGVVLLRWRLTEPLNRMAGLIEQMQKTGRLVKLPVIRQDELGMVSAGFNQLAERVEDQKRRLREHIVELQRLNMEFDRLAGVKDDFLATISHQLRTPLAAIVQGIELMHDSSIGSLNDEQRSLVVMMQAQAQRLMGLVDDSLDLSMLKSGRRPLTRQTENIEGLLKKIYANWQTENRSRSIRLECPGLPSAYMDAQAVEEVVNHLLRNAWRHAPEGTEILIRASANASHVHVSVQDHGSGLSEKQVAQLFQPFVHLQTPESPGSEGSGLGLAFCRQVIERHRGHIYVDSSPGVGTTVTFTLPIPRSAFLFEEACRLAQEEAEHDRGQYGVVLVKPQPLGTHQDLTACMREAELVLRRNTHRGDHFVSPEPGVLAIVAVTDSTGLALMVERLKTVAAKDSLPIHFASAVYPNDGKEPKVLIERANERFAQPVLKEDR